MASQLSTSACARLHTAFRPATYTAYTRMFSDFIAFLVVAGLCLTQVSTLQVLAFTEFLYLNRFSPSNIANHLAGIKAMFIIYNLDYTAFLDHRIQLYLKSLKQAFSTTYSTNYRRISTCQNCRCLRPFSKPHSF